MRGAAVVVGVGEEERAGFLGWRKRTGTGERRGKKGKDRRIKER
jgi:hypothetical protein